MNKQVIAPVNRLFDFIYRKHWFVIILVLVISIPLAYLFSKLTFKEDMTIYFEKDDPDLVYYYKVQKTYGNEERIIIVFKDENIFSNEMIKLVRGLTSMCEESDGVTNVLSLTKAKEAVSDRDSVSFREIVPQGSLSDRELEKIKNKFITNETFINSLISRDGKTTGIIVELDQKKYSIRDRLFTGLMKKGQALAGNRVKLHIAGAPYVYHGFGKLMERDLDILLPVSLGCIFAFTAFMVKSVFLSLLCMTNLVIVMIWTIGMYLFFEGALNNVTVIMPPLLLCVSIQFAIHLTSQYKRILAKNGGNVVGAIADAAKSSWFPSMFSCITTVVGFVSFFNSEVIPVRMMGIYTGFGVLFAYVLSYSFLPAMVIVFRRWMKIPAQENAPSSPESGAKDVFTRALLRIGEFPIAHYRLITVAFIIVMVVSIIGLTKVTFETDINTYLTKDNPMKQDIDFIDENYGGTLPILVVIKAKDAQSDFTNPRVVKNVEQVQKAIIRQYPYISSSLSIADYYKEIHRAFNDGKQEYYKVPDSRNDITDYYELGESSVLDRVVSMDQSETRMIIQIRSGSEERAQATLAGIKDIVHKKMGGQYTCECSGLYPLWLKIARNMKATLIKSFIMSFFIILFMMYFVCKKFNLTMISVLPDSLFPVCLTFGIMGWMNIPLDVVTVMIASVTNGLAIDNSIHYIIWYKRNISAGLDMKGAIFKSYKDVGKPMVISGLILTIGFGVLLLGSLKPTKVFGASLSFSMFFALLGDLIVLQALIILFRIRKFKKENNMVNYYL